MSVDVLRKELADLEAERRFGGRAYPEGLAGFPRVLPGQGFFPGGDGLWRDRESLKRPSPYAFPVGGIMFLGNDFGTLETFNTRKLHENPPTWQWLRKRIELAGLPGLGALGFYTNAFLGLRTDRPALADPMDHLGYRALCAEYLTLQIRTQMPKLIVVFGDRAAGLLSPLIGLSDLSVGQAQPARFEEKSLWVLPVSHPHSDIGKSPAQREEEGKRLAEAWCKARQNDAA